MLDTPFTRLVGASAPIQSAAMPGISTPELVAAVAEAGGLGMLGAAMMSARALDAALESLARTTRGVFGVNFLMPFLDPACVPVAARRARVVEFFYGAPDLDLVERVHEFGALASWQVGSLAEAVAAGGIATARSLAAVLACGCGAARIGTRFVAATESGAHPAYVDALLEAAADDTCLTEAFSVSWPAALHRVLRSAIAAADALTDGVIGELQLGERALPIPRFSAIAPTRTTTGSVAAMALYAGESVANVTSIQPAAAILAELVAGAEQQLREAGRDGASSR